MPYEMEKCARFLLLPAGGFSEVSEADYPSFRGKNDGKGQKNMFFFL